MNNVLQRPVFKSNWGCMYQGWRDCIIIIIIMGRKLIKRIEEWDNKYGLNVNGRPIDLQSI